MIERPQPYIRQIHGCIIARGQTLCGFSGSEEIVEELRKVTKEDLPQIVDKYMKLEATNQAEEASAEAK